MASSSRRNLLYIATAAQDAATGAWNFQVMDVSPRIGSKIRKILRKDDQG